MAPLIAATLELNRSGFSLRTEQDESVDVEWFAAHAGHDLTMIDEYGVIDGQCSKRWTCSHGGTFPCELAAKHEGACGKKSA